MDYLIIETTQRCGWMVFQGGSFDYQKFSRQTPEEVFL